MFSSTSSSKAKALASDKIVLHGEILWKDSGGEMAMERMSSRWRRIKKTTAHSQPYESVVRKQKSTNQEAVLHQTLELLEPWPWIC